MSFLTCSTHVIFVKRLLGIVNRALGIVKHGLGIVNRVLGIVKHGLGIVKRGLGIVRCVLGIVKRVLDIVKRCLGFSKCLTYCTIAFYADKTKRILDIDDCQELYASSSVSFRMLSLYCQTFTFTSGTAASHDQT